MIVQRVLRSERFDNKRQLLYLPLFVSLCEVYHQLVIDVGNCEMCVFQNLKAKLNPIILLCYYIHDLSGSCRQIWDAEVQTVFTKSKHLFTYKNICRWIGCHYYLALYKIFYRHWECVEATAPVFLFSKETNTQQAIISR